MNKRFFISAMVLLIYFNTTTAQQISVTSLAQVYNQDFNSLESSGNAGTAMPSGWYFTGSPYRTNYGNTNNGGLYSFGDTSSITERSLGSIGSGSATPSFGAKFVNNTGSTITSISLSFNVELWRLGQKPALRLDSSAFSYNVGVDSLNAAGWITVSSLKLITPDTSASAAGAVNGNLPLNRKAISATVTGLAIANGSNFWIKWTELNVSGSDDGLSVDDLAVTFTGGVVPSCTEPANSVSNVVASATSTTAISGSFTGTSPASDGYLVLIDSNATVPSIADASTYSVSQVVGTATVISNGTSTTFSRSGLVQNTIYNVYVFPYNNVSCLDGPNYKTSSPGNDTAKTLLDACPEPSVNPTNLIFTSVGNNNINGQFNRTFPSADGYIVVQSLSSNIGYPLDSVNYNVGDSISLGSFKSKVADVSANASDTTFSITGLTQGTKYYVAVIPYKLCGAFKNYRRTASNGVNRDDTTTTGTPPPVDCTQPTGVSNTSIVKLDSTTNSISIKWTKPANADSVMIAAGPNATIGFVTIRDTAMYVVGTTIPGSEARVYYRGADSSFTLTGLTANTVYKILLVSFNNRNCTNGPNYAGVSTTTVKTALSTGVRYNNAEAEFSLFPNPSNNGSLFVKFKSAIREEATLEIVDMLGRKVFLNRVAAGNDMQTIDVSSLAKGTYILNIVYKGSNNVSTFIVE